MKEVSLGTEARHSPLKKDEIVVQEVILASGGDLPSEQLLMASY